jgi:AraC-like DNA-binding protein
MRRVMDDTDYTLLSHPVAAVSKEYPDGYGTLRHCHSRAQLVCAIQGVMTIRTDRGVWVLPPNRGAWIPAMVYHQIFMSGHVSMRTLFFETGWSSRLPERLCLVNVGSLLRELIVAAVEHMQTEGATPQYDRVLAVVEDHLEVMDRAPFNLPVPNDDRLKAVTVQMLSGQGEDRSMQEWARIAGASVRNLRRLFVKETGMNFVRWRQQARLMEALRHLAARQPVTVVALRVGYETPSAFIGAFKKEFGLTPSQYFQDPHDKLNQEPGPRRRRAGNEGRAA